MRGTRKIDRIDLRIHWIRLGQFHSPRMWPEAGGGCRVKQPPILGESYFPESAGLHVLTISPIMKDGI